jgi:hypothetical protein
MARPKKQTAEVAEVKQSADEISQEISEIDAAFGSPDYKHSPEVALAEVDAASDVEAINIESLVEEIVEARPVQVVAPEPEPVVESKPVPALELLLAIDPKKLVDDYLDGHKSKLCTIEFVKENKDKLKSLIHGLLDIQAACLEKLPKEAFSVSTMKSEIHEVKRQYEVLEFQCSRI